MVLGSGLLLGYVSPLWEFRKGPTHPPLLGSNQMEAQGCMGLVGTRWQVSLTGSCRAILTCLLLACLHPEVLGAKLQAQVSTA